MAKKQRKKTKKRPVSAFNQKSRFYLPWPYIFFLLLCVGVLLAGWTFKTNAADIIVKAKVPADPITEPAVITNPVNGQRFTEYPISVSGTCPKDSYIKLYRNDVFSGSALCTAGGSFQLSSDLFLGANRLTARVFNVTDDEGPEGTPVTIYLDPKPAPPGAPARPPANSPPFIIKTEFRFVGYFTGQTGRWRLELGGGTPPYAINADWGDGTNSVISKNRPGEIIIQHKYETPALGPRNSYTVKITGSDSEDNKASLEFFVIVNSKNLPELVADTIPTARPPENNWLWIAWPAYAVIILMLISYYLGEREELLKLKKKGVIRGQRA